MESKISAVDKLNMDVVFDLKIVRDNAIIPTYAKPGDAGMDLHACIDDKLIIQAGERKLIPTGIAIAIATEHIGGFIHPRSGKACKYGLSVANSPGTIDSGYRDEIMVCAHNINSNALITIEPGEAIAQIVFKPVYRASFRVVDSLDGYDRGGGFGSTD